MSFLKIMFQPLLSVLFVILVLALVGGALIGWIAIPAFMYFGLKMAGPVAFFGGEVIWLIWVGVFVAFVEHWMK